MCLLPQETKSQIVLKGIISCEIYTSVPVVFELHFKDCNEFLISDEC
jgi:hypothetical protein